MGKIINWQGQEIEVVSVEEALTFFRGRKGEYMTRRSFMQKVYRRQLPYHKSPKGNYWFDTRVLLGFTEEKTAA
jgi:hypothetical protein